jgi:3-dehydroquinate synthetase
MQQNTSDRFDAMQQMFNARFDRLQLAIWSIGGGVILTLIGLLITQIIQGK